MDLDLTGKVVIVTGAASGIGRRTAELYAAEGARVALCDTNTEHLAHVHQAIATGGGTSRPYTLDVTDYVQACEVIAKVVNEWGPLYAVCNVAGVFVGVPFEESEPENWEREIEVNLKGVMNVCRAAMPEIVKLEYNKIVNVASVAGVTGERHMVSYSAAKGGVVAFTKSLARLLAKHRTNVNCLCPGLIDTPMIGNLDPGTKERWAKGYLLKRLGTPEDMAKAILFLGSSMSDWMTGQAINVDGGFVL